MPTSWLCRCRRRSGPARTGGCPQLVGIIQPLPLTPGTEFRKEGAMGRPKSRVSKVRVVGPLAPSVTEFEDRLRAIGYTALSSVVHLRLLAHLNRWLDARQVWLCELTDEVVE